MPDALEYIGPLDDLTRLAASWRKYAASLSPATDRHRLAGIKSAMARCADELDEVVRVMLAADHA